MPLFNQIKTLCAKLAANPGWLALFAKHGLELGAADLAVELQKSLTIDRTLVGFGDFADDGVRAIEPGKPSRSLLYHALASPNVLNAPDGTPLTLFPTPAELDAVENYIFGVNPPTLAEIQARFPGKPLAVIVFACEYRPAPQTTHGRHADMAFARTGVARVGTRPPRYVPAFRGFFPELPDAPFALAVSPARYAAYLAVQLPGVAPGSPPNPRLMRPQKGDNGRQFWVPVHKLFPGDECLNGLTLTVTFEAAHANEKIFRAHKLLADKGLGKAPPSAPPFRFTEGLAELSTDADLGPGWLVPTVHPHFVQEAKTHDDKPVTFDVPKNPRGTWATIDLWSISRTQAGPEYLHARTEVLPDGGHRDLNQFNTDPDTGRVLPVDARVRKGGYKALNYVDFTADGAVGVNCPQVQGAGGGRGEIAAGLLAGGRPRLLPILRPEAINVVLHRGNIDRVEGVVTLAESFGAVRLELANIQFVGWAARNRGALLPDRDAVVQAERAAAQAAARLRGRMKVVFVPSDHYGGRPKPCLHGWGRRVLTVNPSGAILPCPTAGVIAGLRFENVRQRSLRWAWEESEAFNRFRGTAWMREPCRSCPEREADFGGCRCQAALLTGDGANADPACALSPQHERVRKVARGVTALPLYRQNPG